MDPTRADAELEALVRATYHDVWRLCAALAGTDAADDLAQETFARAARSLRSFRGDSSARTWVLTVARRACADELRGRYRRRRRDDRLAADAALAVRTASGAHPPAPGSELEQRQLLAAIDADRRAAFVLTQLIGLSYAEAAAVCDCPPGTIRSRVARARADLIELLDSGVDAARDARR